MKRNYQILAEAMGEALCNIDASYSDPANLEDLEGSLLKRDAEFVRAVAKAGNKDTDYVVALLVSYGIAAFEKGLEQTSRKESK